MLRPSSNSILQEKIQEKELLTFIFRRSFAHYIFHVFTLTVKTSCLDKLKDLLGPVARDMVSANHGLNSIETYTFLTLVVNTG